MLDKDLLNRVLGLSKEGYAPPGVPPMDPMAAAGGAPPPMPGMPPGMDPMAAAGGAPPPMPGMPPAGPPPDPSMVQQLGSNNPMAPPGGAPPGMPPGMDPAAGGMPPIQISAEDLQMLVEQAAQGLAQAGAPAEDEEAKPKGRTTNTELEERIDGLEDILVQVAGALGLSVPEGGVPPAGPEELPEPGMEAPAGLPEDFAGMPPPEMPPELPPGVTGEGMPPMVDPVMDPMAMQQVTASDAAKDDVLRLVMSRLENAG